MIGIIAFIILWAIWPPAALIALAVHIIATKAGYKLADYVLNAWDNRKAEQ